MRKKKREDFSSYQRQEPVTNCSLQASTSPLVVKKTATFLISSFQNLMKLQVADAKAHIMIPIVQQRIEICEKLSGEYAEELYKDILSGK